MVNNDYAKVETVLADYPAQQQGVLVGDEITYINNSRVIDVQTDLIQVIQSSNGDDIYWAWFEIMKHCR